MNPIRKTPISHFSYLISQFFIILLRFYQIILSPFIHFLFPETGCRFRPTCSQYTINSIQKHGLIPGLKKGLHQFLRCQPFRSPWSSRKHE